MYGFLIEALHRLVVESHGDETWRNILHDVDVEVEGSGSFVLHKIYPDSVLYALVDATVDILQKQKPELLMTKDKLLEEFGRAFWKWTVEYRYDNLLKVLGGNLRDFLTNLDALHDHLSSVYTGMQAPSFRCADGVDGELFLYYYSVREGLHSIVAGIVKAVASEVYKVQVFMEVVPNPEHLINDCPVVEASDAADTMSNASSVALSVTSSNYFPDILRKDIKPVVFRVSVISELNPMKLRRTAQPTMLRRSSILGNSSQDIRVPERNLISPVLMCQAFPFHLVFDRNMEIRQMGLTLQRLVTKRDSVLLPELFDVVRPHMPLSFDIMMQHINGVFILKSRRNALQGIRGSLRLKGQMLYDSHTSVMVFLCSPRIGSMTQLKNTGLYLSDLPIHDATRDLLLQAESAVAEHRLMQQLEEAVDSLRQAKADLQREKRQTEQLLYSILPEAAANALRQGQAVPAEKFERVTILFSDIKGFTDICRTSEPLQVVRMLNEMYTRFDQLVEMHKVYKVETIGDAYMVVGGLPVVCDDHAHRVARQALDMMSEARQVKNPKTGEHLEIRIGIHTGTVMAGVVGQRMPRYCLFGNNVNIASRTESTGAAGRIHLTSYTHRYIQDCPDFSFETCHPMVEMKGVKPDIQTYFLKDERSLERRYSVENYSELHGCAFFQESTLPEIPEIHSRCNSPPTTGNIDLDVYGDDNDDDDDAFTVPESSSITRDSMSPPVGAGLDFALAASQVIGAVLPDRKQSDSGSRRSSGSVPHGGSSPGSGFAQCPLYHSMARMKEARESGRVRKIGAIGGQPASLSADGESDASLLSPSQIRRMSESLDLALSVEQHHIPLAIPIRLRRRESALCQLIHFRSHEDLSPRKKPSETLLEMKKWNVPLADGNGNKSGSPDHSTTLVLLRPISPRFSLPCLLEYDDAEFLLVRSNTGGPSTPSLSVSSYDESLGGSVRKSPKSVAQPSDSVAHLPGGALSAKVETQRWLESNPVYEVALTGGEDGSQPESAASTVDDIILPHCVSEQAMRRPVLLRSSDAPPVMEPAQRSCPFGHDRTTSSPHLASGVAAEATTVFRTADKITDDSQLASMPAVDTSADDSPPAPVPAVEKTADDSQGTAVPTVEKTAEESQPTAVPDVEKTAGDSQGTVVPTVEKTADESQPTAVLAVGKTADDSQGTAVTTLEKTADESQPAAVLIVEKTADDSQLKAVPCSADLLLENATAHSVSSCAPGEDVCEHSNPTACVTVTPVYSLAGDSTGPGVASTACDQNSQAREEACQLASSAVQGLSESTLKDSEEQSGGACADATAPESVVSSEPSASPDTCHRKSENALSSDSRPACNKPAVNDRDVRQAAAAAMDTQGLSSHTDSDGGGGNCGGQPSDDVKPPPVKDSSLPFCSSDNDPAKSSPTLGNCLTAESKPADAAAGKGAEDSRSRKVSPGKSIDAAKNFQMSTSL